jgi:hypothetical protein
MDLLSINLGRQRAASSNNLGEEPQASPGRPTSEPVDVVNLGPPNREGMKRRTNLGGVLTRCYSTNLGGDARML